MDVTIENRPPLRVFFVRHVGAYSRISEAFARLEELAGAAGLLDASAKRLAVYRDDPKTTPEAQLRSDAGVIVPEGAPLPAGLGELRIAGGRHARAVHLGPYEGLGDAWARLKKEWLPKSGERLGNGVTYEVYLNTPMEVRPEELVTELYLPLS